MFSKLFNDKWRIAILWFWWFAQFSVQNGQHSNFQCRLILDESGGVADCVIDSKNRKSCKKCRFNKCLLAGMKATWVCSETKGNVSFLGNLGLKYYYRVAKNIDLTKMENTIWKSKTRFFQRFMCCLSKFLSEHNKTWSEIFMGQTPLFKVPYWPILNTLFLQSDL